ncbi:hypothetical protein [Streptomyces sp. NPDC057301]|uniref:hypothetical protein n=1 Tax=Streptomyces sp. NPDC057301 TaxID=3346093 RepID=UPI003627C4BB
MRTKLSSGILVVVDNNIVTNLGAGTNEDEIYVVRRYGEGCGDGLGYAYVLTERPRYPLVVGADVRLGGWRQAGSSRESGPAPYPDSVELFREGQGRVV